MVAKVSGGMRERWGVTANGTVSFGDGENILELDSVDGRTTV